VTDASACERVAEAVAFRIGCAAAVATGGPKGKSPAIDHDVSWANWLRDCGPHPGRGPMPADAPYRPSSLCRSDGLITMCCARINLACAKSQCKTDTVAFGLLVQLF